MVRQPPRIASIVTRTVYFPTCPVFGVHFTVHHRLPDDTVVIADGDEPFAVLDCDNATVLLMSRRGVKCRAGILAVRLVLETAEPARFCPAS